MKKSNIKIITNGNFPYGSASANYLKYFAFALSDNFHVEVILPSGNCYGLLNKVATFRKGNLRNIYYKHLGFVIHPKNYLGKIFDNLLALLLPFFYLLKEKLKGRCDYLIIYNIAFIDLLLIVFFKLISNTKLIFILPEFYEKPLKGVALVKWYNFYLGLKYLSKYGDAYIVLSHYFKNYLNNTLTTNKPIFILPNIIDPEVFSTIKNQMPKYTIGYAGSPTRKDGVEDLIKSFALLNKKYSYTSLLIIGDTINTVLPDLKIMAEELGIKDKITFTGLVPFEQVPSLLMSCQMLALTRPKGVFAEAGFPTKLGEYFACKKPVVVTKVGDIPFYFENGEYVILVDSEDVESIACGFERILLNSGLSKNMVENAYDWMDKNLNYRNVSHTLNEFIQNICI